MVHKAKKILENGERVLWSGEPDAWRAAAPSFTAYVFAVPWTIFTFGWLWQITDGLHFPKPATGIFQPWEPLFFAGIGLAAFLGGGVMLTLPFWKWFAAKRTIYAVTDRRALKFDTAKPGKAAILPLSNPVTIRRSPEKNGVSDIEIQAGGASNVLLFKAVRESGKLLEKLQQVTEN